MRWIVSKAFVTLYRIRWNWSWENDKVRMTPELKCNSTVIDGSMMRFIQLLDTHTSIRHFTSKIDGHADCSSVLSLSDCSFKASNSFNLSRSCTFSSFWTSWMNTSRNCVFNSSYSSSLNSAGVFDVHGRFHFFFRHADFEFDIDPPSQSFCIHHGGSFKAQRKILESNKVR